ncbi:MAG: CusA/CzcA family heavy metal efflux RND transporter [Polyangiales bacterium]
MLDRVIGFSVRHRGLVLLATLALIAAGVWAFLSLPIDAVPDLTGVQVQVLTASPTLGPLDVERLVTAPAERALAGIPGARELRSISRQGVSAITVVFDDGVSPWTARQLVFERLPAARQSIPAALGAPELGPMTTALGEVYQFEVRGEGRSLAELREILDWQIAPRLRFVPGVIEVNAFGGELRTYEVSADPRRLAALGVTFDALFRAVEGANRVVGGGQILRGPERVLVRGEGLVSGLDDLRRAPVAVHGGVALPLREVADVRFAPMLRQGASTRDGRGEVVVGMAMMLVGENSRAVAQAVDRAARDIERSLPRGVRIEPFYDRTTLVQRTIHTVRRSLVEGAALVVVALFLMLRNLRAGLIGASMIPLCMMAAFIGMRAVGVSGNLMSLGAIDFGLVVDGAIIVIENAVHHLAVAHAGLRRPLDRRERDLAVVAAAREVRGATAFGELIIALVYVPVLALEGVEGRMFRPMALTVLFALAGAFVLSLTFVPAAASLLLPSRVEDRPSPAVRLAEWAFHPALRWTLARPLVTLAVAVALTAGGALLASRLGSEFVPQLDEGALVIEVVRQPSVSLEESVRQTALIERVLRRFSEVVTVVSKTGRPEIANDPMGAEQSDVFVMLRPRAAESSRDREALVGRMSSALRAALPGIAFGFSQPIQMRTNELVSGARADVAVRVSGDDLGELARLGERVVRLLSRVPGATDVRVDRLSGLPVLRVVVDREVALRRGVSVDEVLRVVDAVGGVTVGEVIEGSRRFPLRVRLADAARDNVDAVRRLPIRLPDGSLAQLGELARVERVDEPNIINRESGQRRLVVQANVRGRDLGGFVDEAQARARSLRLPPGYHLSWGGQFENLARARARLAVVVPIVLALIFGLLYATFGEPGPAALIFLNVPVSAVGGVVALALRGMPLSISAGVGFIALFGVAVLNGLVLVAQVRAHRAEGLDARRAAEEGAHRRLRPVLTTALVATLGFLPMALATGAGAEVQRPLATVVIGGLVTATALTLLVLPTLMVRFARSGCRSARARARAELRAGLESIEDGPAHGRSSVSVRVCSWGRRPRRRRRRSGTRRRLARRRGPARSAPRRASTRRPPRLRRPRGRGRGSPRASRRWRQCRCRGGGLRPC